MHTLFKQQILNKCASLILLGLAALFLGLLLRAPLAAVLAQQSPAQPADVLINQLPCAAFSERGIDFDFLGYLPQGDETTILAWRITNPGSRALDAVGFTANGWTALTPADHTVHGGVLGDYSVRWALHNLTPSHEAFSFQPQADWFRAGAQETFVLTVGNFDPQQQLFAWVRANLRLTQVHLKPAEHNCLLALPTPSPTPTATATAASPLPTPTPNPGLTLDDYSFSEPRVVLTHTQNLMVLEWLSDNDRSLIARENDNVDAYEQWLQTLDVNTGQTQTFGKIGPMWPTAVWLADAEKVAFLTPLRGTGSLHIASAAEQQDMEVVKGNFWDTITGDGNQVMVLASKQQAPYLFDDQGNRLPIPTLNLHNYGLNINPLFGATLRWHPKDAKVAIFDSGGFIVFDLETGHVQPFQLDAEGSYWAFDGEWSPDGNLMAVLLVRGAPPFRETRLGILNMLTGEVQALSGALPLTWISDFEWAPNGRQLFVAGAKGLPQDPQYRYDTYLVDTLTAQILPLEQIASVFQPTYQDINVAWSRNGSKLLFRCRPTKMPNEFAICESLISIGGA